MSAALDVERVLCALGELDNPGSRAFTIAVGADRSNWPLRGLVVRRGAELRAYVNRCPHAGHPLNLRPHDFLTQDRTLLLCNSHGALFEIGTGLCVAGPCSGAWLRPVPIEVRDGYVLLAAGVCAAELAAELDD
jgi:nitrite reductase/ring-hydroxylating ferredoxin subunit